MKCINYKFCWLFALLILATAYSSLAQHKKSKVVKGSTESEMVFRIYGCLANEDPYCYLGLFPDLDTMSKLVMYYGDPSSKDYREMAALQRQPAIMLMADSAFKAKLKRGFDDIIEQGKQQGIHWNSIIPVRYELVKARQTRDTLYEKLAPNRYTGYFFVMDGLTRKTYGFVVSEMLQIKEEWYGGYLGQVFLADSKDEYDDMLMAAKREKKRPKPVDTAQATTAQTEEKDEDEVNNEIQKLIVERKFYTGMFDNEIPVQLYVRSLKGSCPEVICAWEAIYKFGDQDDYILLTVAKTAEGKWLFTEEPPAGSMELSIKDGVYTGTWTSTDGQTGYEVKLSEAPASNKKIERLEGAILDLKGFGK